MAYRAWSHWRGWCIWPLSQDNRYLPEIALKGSDHLHFILDHRLFRAVSTAEVEAIYKQASPNLAHSFQFVTRTQVEEGKLSEEQLLLKPGSHTLVAQKLGVPELSTEIERAVWQVERSLEKKDMDLPEKAKVEVKELQNSGMKKPVQKEK